MDLLDASSSGQWPYSKDDVFDALSLATLKVPGLRIDSRDREAGQLVVQGPKGFFLPGERITVSVREVSPQLTEVEMTSSERSGGALGALANANKVAEHMRGILQAAMQSLAARSPVATPPTEPKDQSQDPATRLRTLQSLLTQGLITQEDFDARKKEILSQI